MRYGSDYDEGGFDKQKHAERDRIEWEKDRRDTERMWRESENRRAEARWEQTREHVTDWVFQPILGARGDASGWNVFLNGHKVGLIIRVRNDLVVITTGDTGSADVHYVRPQGDVSPDANQIMAAFQRQLPAGAR